MAFTSVATLLAALTTSAASSSYDVVATFRDFQHTAHPDFGTFWGYGSTGCVNNTLNADGKPILSGSCDNDFTSPAAFEQWYSVDTPAVTQSLKFERNDDTGMYSYASNEFFPLDGIGCNDEEQGSNNHNMYFTTEIVLVFTFKGGETFNFRGDDDVWVFIDRKLAVDLGGVHSALEGEVALDDLGLTKGENYELHVFHAERQCCESNFMVETTIRIDTDVCPNQCNAPQGHGVCNVQEGSCSCCPGFSGADCSIIGGGDSDSSSSSSLDGEPSSASASSSSSVHVIASTAKYIDNDYCWNDAVNGSTTSTGQDADDGVDADDDSWLSRCAVPTTTASFITTTTSTSTATTNEDAGDYEDDGENDNNDGPECIDGRFLGPFILTRGHRKFMIGGPHDGLETVAECALLCNKVDGCLSFSHREMMSTTSNIAGRCYIYSSAERMQDSDTFVHYVEDASCIATIEGDDDGYYGYDGYTNSNSSSSSSTTTTTTTTTTTSTSTPEPTATTIWNTKTATTATATTATDTTVTTATVTTATITTATVTTATVTSATDTTVTTATDTSVTTATATTATATATSVTDTTATTVTETSATATISTSTGTGTTATDTSATATITTATVTTATDTSATDTTVTTATVTTSTVTTATTTTTTTPKEITTKTTTASSSSASLSSSTVPTESTTTTPAPAEDDDNSAGNLCTGDGCSDQDGSEALNLKWDVAQGGGDISVLETAAVGDVATTLPMPTWTGSTENAATNADNVLITFTLESPLPKPRRGRKDAAAGDAAVAVATTAEAAFNVDPSSGVVTVAAPLDYETVPAYTLLVVVTVTITSTSGNDGAAAMTVKSHIPIKITAVDCMPGTTSATGTEPCVPDSKLFADGENAVGTADSASSDNNDNEDASASASGAIVAVLVGLMVVLLLLGILYKRNREEQDERDSADIEAGLASNFTTMKKGAAAGIVGYNSTRSEASSAPSEAPPYYSEPGLGATATADALYEYAGGDAIAHNNRAVAVAAAELPIYSTATEGGGGAQHLVAVDPEYMEADGAPDYALANGDATGYLTGTSTFSTDAWGAEALYAEANSADIAPEATYALAHQESGQAVYEEASQMMEHGSNSLGGVFSEEGPTYDVADVVAASSAAPIALYDVAAQQQHGARATPEAMYSLAANTTTVGALTLEADNVINMDAGYIESSEDTAATSNMFELSDTTTFDFAADADTDVDGDQTSSSLRLVSVRRTNPAFVESQAWMDDFKVIAATGGSNL